MLLGLVVAIGSIMLVLAFDEYVYKGRWDKKE